MHPSQEELAGLIDADDLRSRLTALTGDYDGDGSDTKVRSAVLSLLKSEVKTARDRVQEKLNEDGGGLLCASRLSHVQDELIRVIYDFAVRHVYRVKNPSAAERMSVAAVGGYGRGTLAPGSDIDLLFILPYKQTPWGEQVVEYILYMLWDLGFKVGHATRNIDECIRLSRSDMTIRTAVLEARHIWGDAPLFEDLDQTLRHRCRERNQLRIHRGKAAGARPASPAPRGRLVIWSNPTSRKERAGFATSTRFSGSPSITTGSTSNRNWSRKGS